MKVGLVGYAGSGKSTVFQWLTAAIPDPARIQQGQLGTCEVPDDRLAAMITHFKPKKNRYAVIDFMDTPGLIVTEKKDNPRRLGILREAEGLMIVLDGFTGADLVKQLQGFRSELMFADLEIISNRISKLVSNLKKPKPAKERDADQAEHDLLVRIVNVLEAEQSPLTLGLKDEEEKAIRSFQLLTLKPELVFINQGEAMINKDAPAELKAIAPIVLAAPVKLEMELIELDDETREIFMADLGLTGGSQKPRIIHEIFDAMGQMVFFTVGHDECRSWAIPKDADAVDAAGQIHSDLARRFVRAEVIGYEEFLAVHYSEKDAKAKGIYRLEGKTYRVKDGDILNIIG